MSVGFDLSQESYEEPYAKVADGVWSICEDHFHPAGCDFLPQCNNRGFVYEVVKTKNNNAPQEGKGGRKKHHLIMSGIPGKSCIDAVKKIEEETKLELTLIVGGGDFHHMSTTHWLDAFPNVTILQSDKKFPNTRNGKEILANPKYQNRIELSSDPSFPTLKEYEDTVRFFGFDQWTSYEDKGYLSKSVDETTKETFWSFMSKFPNEPATEPVFLVWHYHVPTKQLLYDHNFLFYWTKEEYATFPFPFWVFMKKETFASAAKEPFPHGPMTIEGCRAHCEQMQKIVELDVRAVTDYHSKPGVQVRTWTSKVDFQTDFVSLLKQTGEHDPTGQAMYEIMRPKTWWESIKSLFGYK